MFIIAPVSPTLTVQKLESQTGYTIINLGFSEVVEQTQTIVHLIRRNHIEEIIHNVENELKQADLSPWIRNKIETIKRKAGILIAHRQKRGLMNIVGKTSKWLFGTMDAEDEQVIDKQIRLLEANNEQTIEGLNQQIRINDYFNETLRMLTQNNFENQNKILKQYDDLSVELKNLLKYQKTLEVSLKLQIIEDKVDHILDNIASIKSGILHPGILTSEEISEFKITVEKLENARTGILLMDNDKLLINIKIPIKYKKIPYKLLTPIPDKNNQEISEEPQLFLEINETKYVMDFKPMYENELKPLETCLNTVCERRLNVKEKIVQLDSNVVLGINLKEPLIINNCDDRKIKVKGNFIFHVQNCNITIHNKTFSHTYKTFEDNDIFEILYNDWEKTNITLKELTLQHIDNLKEIHKIKFQKKIIFGIQGIAFIIIIVLVVGMSYMICKKQKFKYIIERKNLHQESKQELKEGGVMLSTENNIFKLNLFKNNDQ